MSNFISNLDKKDKDVLIRAAKQTNTQIYIQDKAMDANERKIPGCVGVFAVNENVDTTDMWIAFNELKHA